MTTYYTQIASPLGTLILTGTRHALTGLTMPNQKHTSGIGADWQERPELFITARQQLAEYFSGQRQTFDLPLAPAGTTFQQSIWQALQDIGFGHLRSYGQLAQAIGRPKAVRAVGAANGRNPISIIIPCHRVVGANGKLTGYSGGLDRKRWLLKHEGALD